MQCARHARLETPARVSWDVFPCARTPSEGTSRRRRGERASPGSGPGPRTLRLPTPAAGAAARRGGGSGSSRGSLDRDVGNPRRWRDRARISGELRSRPDDELEALARAARPCVGSFARRCRIRDAEAAGEEGVAPAYRANPSGSVVAGRLASCRPRRLRRRNRHGMTSRSSQAITCSLLAMLPLPPVFVGIPALGRGNDLCHLVPANRGRIQKHQE